MTSNGGGDEEFRQVNHMKGEYQGDVSVVVGNGPDSRRYDELDISKVDENVKKGGDQVVVQGHPASQAPQLQPQGSLMHWERFLHVRSIKVMLVENDDSTRHIVTALLRNCNYEVIEAANGLQAWKILEDLSNHIDIVLTEVVMPCLSGIGLLCKIMSHKTRKNIPVIMMSSHDSMGLVFKCLSKGAVDFLLKPIRKNELKNLWQHVWRRCHSSSGSGSESGTHAQKSVNSKRSDDSISIIGDDIGSTGDGSDDGSGTQSSWTKQAVELESPQAASPCDQIAEHPDSTCGLVIHSAETPATRDFHDQEGQLDDVGKGQELATVFPVKDANKRNGIEHNNLKDFDPSQNIRGDAIDMRGPQPVNGEFEALKKPEKILDRNTKTTNDSNGVTVTESSLKRPSGVKEVQNGHSILRHSELSAFTRYNTSSNAIKTGTTASSSQHDNRSEIMKKESTHDAHSDGYLIYQGSNEVCNNTGVGYSTNEYCTTRSIHKEISEVRSLINCLHPSFTFKPIQTDPRYFSQQAVPRKCDDIPPADLLDLPRVHHIHHHHHVHHYHDVEPKQPPSNHEDLGLKELAASAPHCGSSNVLGEVVEGNLENYSLNRSASGSKHGSNWQNGSSTAVNLEGKKAESGGGVAGKSGSGVASGSGSENRIDQQKSAEREAALMKFRQKRKDRCFQKKVRYQNRKRLAEQRPRVRGQFVKQTGRESSSNAADG